ncbi:MAG: tRNA 2-thiocytidine(32) synthetase TtcA, partial [Mesorhizobium sp.]
AMKAMLDDIEKRMPGRKDTMIRAMTNVRPSHLLDRKLFDFAALDARLTMGKDISDDV